MPPIWCTLQLSSVCMPCQWLASAMPDCSFMGPTGLAGCLPITPQVVRRLEGEGGEEALLDLCRRFRECFVSALQPQVGSRQGDAA